MALKIYNTLTRKKETFKPIKKGEVKIYVCGPTVSGVPHLGHARQQITFDTLRRVLLYSKYKVKFVSNITDIEDKIINKANELGRDIKEFSDENEKLHKEDYEKLGIMKPDVQPHATEYVKEMIELIKKLEKKDFTYVIKNDGVYYDVSKFKEYGKLSHQKTEDLMAGARIEAKEQKRNKEDFVLWKFSKPGEPQWDSPWGKGRPGWHIECSAMSESILGLPLDIHGGGQDLIFPHHEDEIAQSEAAFGKKFSNYWVHNGLVNVEKVKMSKSLGNFKTIRDLFKDYKPEVIKYFVLSTHYRKPIDFSKNSLDDVKNSYERIKNIISEIKDDGKTNKKYVLEFKKVINDDLNMPQALAIFWELLRDKKAEGKINTIKEMDKIFGLNLLEKEKEVIPKEIIQLAEEREEARKNKDWGKSDKLRVKIKEIGYEIKDMPSGFVLSKI
ncbi:MAG: cysteine--tRNA ligase [Nanoarchaeota archaeon]|nr:cysteine--tRNA ligase [Nanoarchaeota archaeon]